MKKILFLMLYTIVILTLSSCNFFEDEKSSKRQEGVKTIVELPDSVKQKLIAQDEQMSVLLNKVDTLTTELNLTKTDNVELKKQIEEMKKPKRTWAFISIGAIALAIIAIVLSILKSQGIKEERVYEIFKQCLDESSRIQQLQEKVNNLISTRNNFSNTLNNLDSKIQQNERMIKQLDSRNNIITKQIPQSDPSKPNNVSRYLRIGYAKINSDIYFLNIMDSNQEGCVFKITFKSEIQGEFSIISLDKIKSSNGWDKVIECTGCSIKDATRFDIESIGKCEKEGNDWQMKEPLKIKLSK